MNNAKNNTLNNTQKGYLVNAFAAAGFVATAPSLAQTNRIAAVAVPKTSATI